MKGVLCAAAILLLAALPAHSLECTVSSFNYSRAVPNPVPDGKAVGRGYHILTITELTGFDLVIKFRVQSGQLRYHGGIVDACTSGWIFPGTPDNPVTRAECFSYHERAPCYRGEGIWDTLTIGDLQGIPGGLETSLPKPQDLVCNC